MYLWMILDISQVLRARARLSKCNEINRYASDVMHVSFRVSEDPDRCFLYLQANEMRYNRRFITMLEGRIRKKSHVTESVKK